MTAPSAATVEVLDARPGDLVAPKTPIATLLERVQIYIRIHVPETQIGRIKLGQTGEVRVHQVFGVKLRINDPSGRVRAGMAADVKLDVGKS